MIFQNNTYRMIIFLFGCIGLRLSIGLFARSFLCHGLLCKILAYSLLIMGFGFLFIYFSGIREKGLETGGEKIWWNTLRPIHGILYIIAGYLLSTNQNILSSNVIIFDTLIGLLSWFNKRIYKIV